MDICRKANILVLEDNPYGLLRYDGEPLAPLRAANPADVIYLGSFSKIFAPGLRIGWALVPEHLQRRYYLASEAVTLCPPTLNQMLVSAYLRDYDWKGQIETYRGLYAERCARDAGCTGEHMPAGTSWTSPEGGFFVWVTLPEGVDTYPLLQQGDRCRRRLYSRAPPSRRSDEPVQQAAAGFQRRPAGRPLARACGGWPRYCGKPYAGVVTLARTENGNFITEARRQSMSGIIVVGVDGSGTAKKAAESARDLAAAAGRVAARGLSLRQRPHRSVRLRQRPVDRF